MWQMIDELLTGSVIQGIAALVAILAVVPAAWLVIVRRVYDKRREYRRIYGKAAQSADQRRELLEEAVEVDYFCDCVLRPNNTYSPKSEFETLLRALNDLAPNAEDDELRDLVSEFYIRVGDLLERSRIDFWEKRNEAWMQLGPPGGRAEPPSEPLKPIKTGTGSITQDAPVPGTTIFEDEVQKVVNALDEHRLVVVHAPPGTGKSRVLASVLARVRAMGRVPLWYIGGYSEEDGKTSERLSEAIGSVAADLKSEKLCIVLDEKHGEYRTPEFFDALFRGHALKHSMASGTCIILGLRSSTYNDMVEDGHLAEAEVVELSGDFKDDVLDCMAEQKIGRKLSSQERQWIRSIAEVRPTDAEAEESQLNTLLIDRACLKWIAEKRPLSGDDWHGERDIAETVYRMIIATVGDERKSVLQALALVKMHAAFGCLWLITAVVRWIGTDMSAAQVQSTLEKLAADDLVTSWRPPLRSWTPCWDFSHDLFEQAALLHERKIREDLTMSAIEDAVCSMVGEADDARSYHEALQMWASLASKEGEGFERVVDELHGGISMLKLSETERHDLIAVTAHMMETPGKHLSSRSLLSRSSLHSALVRMALVLNSLMPDPAPPALVDRICFNASAEQRASVLGAGHHVVRTGMSSGQMDFSPIYEFSESEFPSLQRIGRVCSVEPTASVFGRMSEHTPRIRYCQLLMWAQDWLRAGEALERAVREGAEEADRVSVMERLGRIDLAAAVFLRGGLREHALGAYSLGIEIAEACEGMQLVAQLFQENSSIVEGLPDDQLDWTQIVLARSQAPRGGDYRKMSIAIVGVFWALPSGAQVASAVASCTDRPVSARFMYSDTVSGDVDGLVKHDAIIVTGRHEDADMELLLRQLVNEATFVSMLQESAGETGASKDFDFQGIPGLWVAGYAPWGNAAAVEHWLSTDGPKRFADRLKR